MKSVFSISFEYFVIYRYGYKNNINGLFKNIVSCFVGCNIIKSLEHQNKRIIRITIDFSISRTQSNEII
jgi:hypothetical protein